MRPAGHPQVTEAQAVMAQVIKARDQGRVIRGLN